MTDKNDRKRNRPFVGILTKDGYYESYGRKKAEEADFHHSFALSEKGLEYYNEGGDDVLRFVHAGPDNYELEGGAALDPYGKGKKQISALAEKLLLSGAKKRSTLSIGQMHLKTKYEGKKIGRVVDLAKKKHVNSRIKEIK